jgi:hypothetical protein
MDSVFKGSNQSYGSGGGIAEVNPLAGQVARLEKENKRLIERLKQAETIIEFQKKLQRCLASPQGRPHEYDYRAWPADKQKGGLCGFWCLLGRFLPVSCKKTD